MKKTSLAILCACFALLPAFAADIQVTSPAAGASWKIGTTQTVQWSFSGLPASTKVHILLWHDGSNLGKIAKQYPIGTNGAGSFSWNVGAVENAPAAVAGSGYSIRVRTVDDTCVDSSGTFALTGGSSGPMMQLPDASQLGSGYALGHASKPPLPGQIDVPMKMIQVVEPKAGNVLTPYSGYFVRWKFVNVPATGVAITLVGENKPDAVLAANVSDPGEFLWDLEAAPPAPGAYRVQVETLDKQYRGRSGEFTVQENGTIDILAPQPGATIANHGDLEIRWRRGGNIQKLEIVLIRISDGYVTTLASQVDAGLEAKMVVLAAAETGVHRISIRDSRNGNGLAMSGNFIITGE